LVERSGGKTGKKKKKIGETRSNRGRGNTGEYPEDKSIGIRQKKKMQKERQDVSGGETALSQKKKTKGLGKDGGDHDCV